jgi:hypothetical protein
MRHLKIYESFNDTYFNMNKEYLELEILDFIKNKENLKKEEYANTNNDLDDLGKHTIVITNPSGVAVATFIYTSNYTDSKYYTCVYLNNDIMKMLIN